MTVLYLFPSPRSLMIFILFDSCIVVVFGLVKEGFDSSETSCIGVVVVVVVDTTGCIGYN